jgi:branched-chain amino acid aminotransferase
MTITAPLLWLDGAMVDSATAGAPLLGHAAQRGSLVFDVGSFSPTERGTALFRARDHVARFMRSIRIVGLEVAFDEETLVRAAVRAVAESGYERGLVRWSAFLKVREADLVPSDQRAHIAVAAQALVDPPRRTPLRVSVFSDARKAAPDVLPPDTKAAAAYLGPMLARKRAIARGDDDVVLLDSDGDIAEAPIANTFAVVKGALWTPPLGRVLPGITRDSVLAIARAEGIPVREERLPVDVFSSADEAFLTSTSLPIGPIGTVNGRALGTTAPGPVTTKILERIGAARLGKERDEWLTWVK